MIVDDKATKIARLRHEVGIQSLNKLFDFAPSKAPFNPQTGRCVGDEPIVRRRWRQWRDSTFPARVRRRRRRKLARLSRRRNRRA